MNEKLHHALDALEARDRMISKLKQELKQALNSNVQLYKELQRSKKKVA